MVSAAEVEEFRAALNELSAAAIADLEQLWGPIAGADFADQRAVLDPAWPALLATYGELSAVVAADMLEEWLPDPQLEMVRPVDEERALARMRWAIGTAEPLGNLTQLTDELTKQPARSTIARTAQATGVGMARVPSGKTCPFCLTACAAGIVYRSDIAAARRYHGSCDCVAIAVARPADLPAGYDPDALAEVVDAAEATAGSSDPKAVLAALRAHQHTAH